MPRQVKSPSLARDLLVLGDINGDDRDDIIAGALLADGPDNAREDAGQAHIILSP